MRADPGMNRVSLTAQLKVHETLGARIFTSHLLAIGLAITLVSFALLSLIRSYFIDALEQSLLVQSDLIARSIFPGFESLTTDPILPSAFNTIQQQQTDQLSVEIQNQAMQVDPDTLTQVLETLGSANVALTASLQTDVFIIGPDLKLLLSPPNPPADPTFLYSLARGALEGKSDREIIREAPARRLVVASPLRVEGEVIAAIVLSHPMTDLQAVFYNLWLRLGASALISLLLTGMISLFFTRSIQKPVQQLRDASEQLRKGNFDYPLPAGRKDELGALSRAFEMMRARLEDTERARTRFLSDVAHELRTPLTSIKSLTETLQDGAVDDPEVRDRFLLSIERETQRLIRLTRDLLTLTRADVGEFSLQKEPVDLILLTSELLSQFEPEAERKAIQLKLHKNPAIGTVEVDRDRIRQVFINLLDNALRYAPEESTIRLHIDESAYTGIPDSCRGVLRGTRDDEFHDWTGVIVAIADDGPGISPEDLERIFDRFYRVDRARDRARGGSGLGLPIAKAIVESHGGCIWIESPPSNNPDWHAGGTEVKFFLPHTPQGSS